MCWASHVFHVLEQNTLYLTPKLIVPRKLRCHGNRDSSHSVGFLKLKKQHLSPTLLPGCIPNFCDGYTRSYTRANFKATPSQSTYYDPGNKHFSMA